MVRNNIAKYDRIGEYNMEDEKEKKFWQSWMTIVILLAVVVMVAWFNSQSPAIRLDENISIGNGTRVPIENSAGVQIGNGADVQTGKSTGVQIENNTVVQMDNDTFFKAWVAVSFKVINENLDCLYKAGEVRNLTSVEACGRLLAENSNSSLRHMSGYINVSTSLLAVSNEYKKALEDYNIGGVDIVIGAKNKNGSQMSNAIEYIQNGTAHIKLVDKMLSGNNTTVKKFVNPQIGVNTTGY